MDITYLLSSSRSFRGPFVLHCCWDQLRLTFSLRWDSLDIYIWVIIHLVALSQILDDVDVVPSYFCQAVLQNPAVRFQLHVTQPEDVLHGRL